MIRKEIKSNNSSSIINIRPDNENNIDDLNDTVFINQSKIKDKKKFLMMRKRLFP